MGPHPAVADVRRAVREALAGVDGTVLVACSGGADSLALAAATAFEAPRQNRRAGLITVDHGLQPGSAAQAARVAALGYELGFDPVEVVTVAVGTDGGPEAAARTARYRVLAETAEALDAHVLLGHTLDDQAETVLLGLGRGSGPRSIAGMRRADAIWLRPFLGLRRSVTVAACVALGLDPWDDPHNADDAFQRVRLRTEVLPLLEEVLQGGVAEALARTADLTRADLDALDELAELATPNLATPHLATPNLGDQQSRTVENQQDSAVDHGDELEVASLAGLPRAIRTRVLRTWAGRNDVGPLTADHTAALDALITDWHGQGPLHLPGGRAVRRASGKLVVHPSSPDLQE
jgi:tRNA(Ile)-lysidine synthase